jgi:hypothetical protein
MILIEGLRHDIANAMIEGLTNALHIYDVRHFPNTYKKTNLNRLISLVQSDHRYEIHSGIVAEGLSDATRNMMAYGLSSAGSIVVICGGAPNPVNILPTVMVNELTEVPQAIKTAVSYWEHARTWMLKLWEFRSLYAIAPQQIMLVGEKCTPPVKTGGRALPFFGAQGPGLFLHDAMVRAGGKYYLTCALKYASDRANRDAIIDEVHLINPTRIIAMGTNASRMLARVDIDHVKAYHPTYLRRFRPAYIDELVGILQP